MSKMNKFITKGSMKSLTSTSHNENKYEWYEEINTDENDSVYKYSDMSFSDSDCSEDRLEKTSPVPSNSNGNVNTVVNIDSITTESLLKEWNLLDLLPLFQSMLYTQNYLFL